LLPYYLAALLPVSSLTGLKLVSILGILLGNSGLYLWLRSWLGSPGAVVAAALYTYAPFTVTTLYVRGAWSEAFFWGLLPWALLAATYLVAQPRLPIIIIGVVFWTALGLSQLGLTFWALLMLMVMTLIFHRPQALWPLVAALLGLITAAGLTFLRVVHDIAPSPVNLSEHLVYPAQLLASFWGYGVSQPGWEDGLSLSLGLAALGLAILAFVIWRGGPDRRPWFFAGLAGGVMLLVSPLGWLLWQIPGINLLLDYPWQLLGFAALGLAVFAGVGFWLDDRLQQFAFVGAALLFTILPIYANLAPQFIQAIDIPTDPESIYGDNEILLLSHQFLIDNPIESTALEPQAPYMPLPSSTFLRSGDTFYLQVRWQAVRSISKNYKVFAHLIDNSGQVVMQVDLLPQNGDRPTDTWLPGEAIDDLYTFNLPGGHPDLGTVWLGFYDEATQERLPTLGDDEGRAFLKVQ
jgi:hypothetical protein